MTGEISTMSDFNQFKSLEADFSFTDRGNVFKEKYLCCKFLSDPCAHGVRSLGRLSLYLSIYETFLKPCEDLVKTVNVVNVVKT